jgi:hypothetical protein
MEWRGNDSRTYISFNPPELHDHIKNVNVFDLTGSAYKRGITAPLESVFDNWSCNLADKIKFYFQSKEKKRTEAF